MFERPTSIPTRSAEQGPLLDIQLLEELPEAIRTNLWQLVDPAVEVIFPTDFEPLLSKVSAVWQRFITDPDATTEIVKLAGATKEQILLLEHVARGQINPVDGAELVRVMVPDLEDRVWTTKQRSKASRMAPVNSVREMVE